MGGNLERADGYSGLHVVSAHSTECADGDGHVVKSDHCRLSECSGAMSLCKLGHDPALGSVMLLTFTTDGMSFLIFLGLATVFLL